MKLTRFNRQCSAAHLRSRTEQQDFLELKEMANSNPALRLESIGQRFALQRRPNLRSATKTTQPTPSRPMTAATIARPRFKKAAGLQGDEHGDPLIVTRLRAEARTFHQQSQQRRRRVLSATADRNAARIISPPSVGITSLPDSAVSAKVPRVRLSEMIVPRSQTACTERQILPKDMPIIQESASYMTCSILACEIS